MTDPQASLPILLGERANLIDGLQRLPQGCARFVYDLQDAFTAAPGSGHNHQAWPGGYADHLDEVFGIAAFFYRACIDTTRQLAFSLDDVLLVLFLHDLEKPFKRVDKEVLDGIPQQYLELLTDPHALQERVAADYDLALSDEQRTALRYIHGIPDEEYSKDDRVTNQLGAFCHICDYWSARGWHDQPKQGGYLPSSFPAQDG